MFLYFSGSRFKIARGKTFDTIMASNGTLVEICNYANSSKNAFFSELLFSLAALSLY